MIRLLKEEDKQIILNYLHRNEIETSFLYSNVSEFGVENRKDVGRCADYYGFFEGDDLKGILPFYNLGSCLPHYETEDAISPFVQIVKERNFNSLMGMEGIIKPIYQGIEGEKDINEYSESSYFVNRSFKPYTINGLEFCDPEMMNNSEEVIDFIMRVRCKGFHETVNIEDIKKSLISMNLEEDKVLAMRDGKMVSYAHVQAYTTTINQIGSVYTEEDERGKGYCKAVVSELCKRIIFRNKIPTLFVRKNNTPAVKAYSALGFEHFDDYLLIKFK